MPGATEPLNPALNIHGMVAELVLNAPERKNSLSLAAWTRIPEVLQELTDMPRRKGMRRPGRRREKLLRWCGHLRI